MNQLDQVAFNNAVKTAQNGQTAGAYLALKQLQNLYPKDVNLLLWLAFTTSDLKEAQNVINLAANVEPNNPSLDPARQWLSKKLAVASPDVQTVSSDKAPLDAANLNFNFSEKQSQFVIPTTPPGNSITTTAHQGQNDLANNLKPTNPPPSNVQAVAVSRFSPTPNPYSTEQVFPFTKAVAVTPEANNFNSTPVNYSVNYAAQIPNNPSTFTPPPINQPSDIYKKPFSISSKPIIILAVGIIVILGAFLIYTLFIALPPDSEYKSYPSDKDLIDKSAIGDRVRVSAEVKSSAGSKEAVFTLQYCGGLVLKFDRPGMVAKAGKSVYFGKIVERKQLPDECGNFVIISVEQIR
jgi:hypothetical protein